MKTPMQELIERLNSVKPTQFCSIETIKGWAEEMLEKEKEFITNFAMDYVTSGNVGCAIWADSPPELDIDKSARDYYKEYINTTSLDSTEWSKTTEK